MNKNIMLITECLSGRILHDFANSMQGIVGGLEELEENNPNMLKEITSLSMQGIVSGLEGLEVIDKNDADAQKKALSLLKESSDDLMYKHKVMEQAYSCSLDNSSFDKTKSNIENYLKKK
ncbi:MAG: hypothetical protein MUP48_05185 [Wolbachia endosymbiont of Homalodisca vitripennis]|nr:hypothetical protein [Wolbachia endosymbiont of Homalodisca vitripennis]MCJ7454816.1 hypothetical protein [Wolbachia endosymbiont of Homalodisca vitripennis]